MKTLLIGMAAAGLVGVTTARAEQQASSTDKSPSTSGEGSSTQSPSSSSQSSAKQSPSSSSQSSASQSPSTSGEGSSSQSPTSSSSSTSQSPSSSSQTSTSQASSGSTGTSASASTELSGVVKKVDKDKRSLKISSTTGGEQELKVPESATITRDGSQAGLEQVKEGDQVRASFDSSGSKASKIEVTSKSKMGDKDKTGSKSETKGK